ncbi:hypothetical protein SALBM135S_04076 [Streptomyces alboniger]
MPRSCRAASSYDAGLPTTAVYIGGASWTGRGKSRRSASPAPVVRRSGSPRHNCRTCSTCSYISSLWEPKRSGKKTKSLACQPLAQPMPTRPPERLSTIDHSSATRIGSCSGSTTEPALMRTRSVSRTSAAASTTGLGKSPPKEWKCRSGIHREWKPLRSAKRAVSRRWSYLPCRGAVSSWG